MEIDIVFIECGNVWYGIRDMDDGMQFCKIVNSILYGEFILLDR